MHAGGQAVVGVVRTQGGGGGGIELSRRFNPVQSRLPMHPSGRCGARTRSEAAHQPDNPAYFFPATKSTRAALHVSLRSVRIPFRQVAIWPRPRPALAQCSFTSGLHAFATAAVLASLTLQASERSLKCSLTQALMRPSPGWISAQYFLISAAHAPIRGCAIALAVVPKSEVPTRSIQTSGSPFIAVTPFCEADQCKHSLSICS